MNLARIDLVSIQLAVLCAEHGSLSAAAKWAHCSVSTGSYRLSALEDSLGTQLFDRENRGLRLTASGERFVRHARAMLKCIEDMAADTIASPGQERRLAPAARLPHVYPRGASA